MAYHYYQKDGGEESWKIVADTKLDSIKDAMFATVLSVDALIPDKPTKQELAAVKYSGPLYFDLDDAESPGSTGKFAVELVEKLQENGVEPNDLLIYASGGKGFHILVPPEVFMAKVSKVGVTHLPAIYKEMAFQLAVDSMDFRVYTARRGRMFRQPNVLRPNNLYKVQITWDELKAVAFSDEPEEDYRQLCFKPRTLPKSESAPEQASGMMAMYDQCKMKVQKAANKRSKEPATLPKDLPSFDLLLEGKGVREGTGFQKLSLQIAIIAQQRGMTCEDLLAKADGLCETHMSDGYRYNTKAKRLNELERMWNYMEDNPCYEYSAGAVIGLLNHSAPDLRGLQTSKDEVESNLGTDDTEVEADEDYSGVLISRAGIYAVAESGTKKISNVSYDNVTVLRSIDTGLSVMVEADVYVGGTKQRRDAMSNEVWQSSNNMNKFSMSYGSSFLGSDNQARGIFLKVNEKAMKGKNVVYVTDREGVDWVRVPGSSEPDPDKAGFFIWSDNRKVVVPPNPDDVSMVFKGYPEVEGQFRTDLGDAPNLAEWVEAGNKPQLQEFLDNLLNCQTPATIAKYIGWTTACHFRMMFHMKHNQFPLFHVNGAAGQGKTAMATLFMNQHYYKADPKVTSPSSTLFAVTSAIAGSSSIPVVVDEFKPADMRSMDYDKYRAMFRDAYNCRDVARGGGSRDNGDYRALHRTKLAAPICFISEAVESEPALMERVLLLTLVKPDSVRSKKFRDRFEAAKANKHFLGILGKYIVTKIIHRYSLEEFNSEFLPILKASRDELMLADVEELKNLPQSEYSAKAAMKDRTVFNYAVTRFGLRKFQELVESVFEDRYTKLFNEMYDTVVDSATDVATQTTPEWLKVLNAMSEMSAMPEGTIYAMSIGKDYDFIEYNGKPCFVFNTALTYFKYRTYCRAANMKPLFPTSASFQHAILNVSACEEGNYTEGVTDGSGTNQVMSMDALRFAGFIPPKS